ncbi:hypothetical protein E5341_05965 [Ligilactobacillus murinus]|nr:hypothetical protein E5341_05965 [Ligilactobacillus murinus]
MIFLYFCLVLLKSLSQMAFYFSNLILQTANYELCPHELRSVGGVFQRFSFYYLIKKADPVFT